MQRGGGEGREGKEEEEKGKCRREEPTLLLFREVFFFKLYPFESEGGEGRALRLNWNINNRLNHRKLLFLKVRNDLIPQFCVIQLFWNQGDIM